MKILIVDDHAVIHDGLKRSLGEHFPGSTFGGALTSQEALDQHGRDWDLVILDIDMPGRGGIDLLKQMRARKPHLPILIFSMHSEEQFAMRALRAGASGYIPKNTSSEQMVGAIQQVLRGGLYVSAALAEALAANLGRPTPDSPHERLSGREFEVMRMLACGKSTTEIAGILALSIKTVSTYKTRILEKLDLKTSAELIHYAILNGLDR